MVDEIINYLEELCNSLKYIRITIASTQNKLDKLELEMEQYSDKHTPSRDQIVNYLFERGTIREQLSYLQGVEDTINKIQEKVGVKQN